MPAVQQWGRKESIIWPPRGYLYTLGAIFLSLVATGFFVYVRFQFGLTPLERYYLPYYLRSEMAGLTRPPALINCSMFPMASRALGLRSKPTWSQGSTPQSDRTPFAPRTFLASAAAGVPLVCSANTTQLSKQGAPRLDRALGLCRIFRLARLFTMQLVFGLVAFALQLPFSIRKDIRRIKRSSLRAPSQRARSCECQGLHQSRCRRRHRHHDQRFQAPVAHSARCREQALSDRRRHRLRQVEHHSPDALSGGRTRRQRHRLRPGLRVCEAVLRRAPRRHRAQSARRPNAVLESIEGTTPQGRSQGTGRLALPTRRCHESLLRRSSAEDLRSSADLSCRRRRSWCSGCPTRQKSTAASKEPSTGC